MLVGFFNSKKRFVACRRGELLGVNFNILQMFN